MCIDKNTILVGEEQRKRGEEEEMVLGMQLTAGWW